jgi:hypothetical protein
MRKTQICRFTLMFMICNLLCFGSDVFGQSAKLYLDEINRLKEEKTVLSIENETYKHALQLEQQKTAQLGNNLKSIQLVNAERDRHTANLNLALSAANTTITRWHRIATALASLAVLLMMGIALYWHRDAVSQQIRKLMEFRLVRTNSNNQEHNHQPTIARQIYEETNIRPEEIVERLYGRRRTN